MKQKQPLETIRSKKIQHRGNHLLSIWNWWNSLTLAEHSVYTFITLLPVVWLVGWGHILLLIVASVIIYETAYNGGLSLKKPSITTVALIIFGIYRLISVILNSEVVKPSSILDPLTTWISLALLLWYVQSKEIRVRTQVVTWACSVLVIELLVFWFIVQVIFSAPHFTPPRSLMGMITDKGERYIAGKGNSNYLLTYFPEDKVAGGLVRFAFFFPGPEAFSVAASYMSLLALDIKKRAWSVLMFSACVFLLFLSGTRTAWIAFTLTFSIRCVFSIYQNSGRSLIFALIAVFSFIVFSMPVVTDSLYNQIINTTEATGNFRANSTEVRHLIYQRTWEAILNDPDSLLFGRGIPGATVLPGYAPAMVGSHSFFSGTLMYCSGLAGTAIFMTFWISLFNWLYKTRKTRPLSSFLVVLFFTITFATMEFEISAFVVTLLIALQHEILT